VAITLDFHVTVDGVEHSPACKRRFILHVGAPTNTSPEDRVPGTPTPCIAHRKADIIMDLLADQKVALSGEFTDEVGNPVPAPAGATVVYTVDDASIINLTDNGDGTAEAAATGLLGTANVHAEATFDSTVLTGDLQIVVVAGLAERFSIVAGTPEEVTPD
jgi:hypothetical protein